VLDGHQDRAAPLAADADALEHPQEDEGDRGRDADRRVRRKDADRRGREAHDQQRDHEHRLASGAVAEVAEDDPAERARREADAEGRERREGADRRVDLREEQVAEDQRRGGPVQEEVVPLDGGADEAGQGDLTQRLTVTLAFAAKALCCSGHVGLSSRWQRPWPRPVPERSRVAE